MTWRSLAQWLVRLEIPLLALVYVNFVLSDGVPLVAFGLIGLIWVARVFTTGRLSFFTPLDLPILILLAWLPISLMVTTYPWLSLPKVYGVLLGAVFFYAVVNQVSTRRDLAWAAFWLVVTCMAISLAGLIGTIHLRETAARDPGHPEVDCRRLCEERGGWNAYAGRSAIGVLGVRA